MNEAIEQKLKSLVYLQIIDSKLDKIRSVRGGLPEEVRDLEDELEGLRTRIQNFQAEIDQSQKEIANRNQSNRDSKELIRKYETQLMNVKNNREYEALQKEIELANLDVLTNERKIKILQAQVKEKEDGMKEVQKTFDEREKDLEDKKAELDVIVAETQKEENSLLELSDKASKLLEQRLLFAYRKIRNNMRNGLAVVTTDRDACGGCFAIIPPQRRHEIRQHKKLIVCENCGRILVDTRFFEEQGVAIAETQK